jgi:hypothetical protein
MQSKSCRRAKAAGGGASTRGSEADHIWRGGHEGGAWAASGGLRMMGNKGGSQCRQQGRGTQRVAREEGRRAGVTRRGSEEDAL